MDKPTVSIIIPHRNLRKKWLKEAMDSIKTQTYTDYEVIEALGEDLEKINTAIKKSRGRYVLILCDDDKLPENFLEECVIAIEKENNIDIVSTAIQNFGDVKLGEEGRHLPSLYPFFTSLFTRSIYDKVGGLDISVGAMTDVEFWWRCLQGGAKWVITPNTFYYYRRHKEQDSSTCDWRTSRQNVLNKHKHYSW